MLSKDVAYDLLQRGYYDSINAGDMAGAAAVLHEDVEWSHGPVWGQPASELIENLHGRSAVEAVLTGRKQALSPLTLEIRDLVVEGDKGAFLADIGDAESRSPYMGWFELRDGKISRYLVRPL
jgi:ketosteroid isomerase-like protein